MAWMFLAAIRKRLGIAAHFYHSARQMRAQDIMTFKFLSTPRPTAASTRRKARLFPGHRPKGVLPPRELRRIVAEMLG